MKVLLIIPTLLFLLSGCVSETSRSKEFNILKSDKNNKVLLLKDGSTLIVNKYGKMRMFDGEGQPIRMKDGVEMELDNGDLIMMKNNLLWRVYPGKVHNHQQIK